MSEALRIAVKQLDPGLPLPSHAHEEDAGLDLRAATSVTLKPGERAVIPTGIALAIPPGYAGFVQPRSGLAAQRGLGLLNSPGLIDSGYRGEIRLVAVNLDPAEPIEVWRGDKVAQLVVMPVARVELVTQDELPPSPRGTGGFGSTGVS